MNKATMVELALEILTQLDRDEGQAIPVEALKQGKEMGIVSAVVSRLSAAGIVTLGPDREVSLRRSLADLTALDVLQAVWGKSPEHKAARVLYGAPVSFAIPSDLHESEGRN